MHNPDISAKFSSHYHLPHSTQSISTYWELMNQPLLSFLTTWIFFPSSKMLLEQWMVHTSIIVHQLLSVKFVRSKKVSFHKTALHAVPFLSSFCTWLVVGRVLQQMEPCSQACNSMIWLCHQANIILLMLVLGLAMCCLFHTMESSTTWLNGAMLIFGVFFYPWLLSGYGLLHVG